MRAFHYIDWNQLQKEWDEIMKDIKKDLEELDEMSNKEIIKKFFYKNLINQKIKNIKKYIILRVFKTLIPKLSIPQRRNEKCY